MKNGIKQFILDNLHLIDNFILFTPYVNNNKIDDNLSNVRRFLSHEKLEIIGNLWHRIRGIGQITDVPYIVYDYNREHLNTLKSMIKISTIGDQYLYYCEITNHNEVLVETYYRNSNRKNLKCINIQKSRIIVDDTDNLFLMDNKNYFTINDFVGFQYIVEKIKCFLNNNTIETKKKIASELYSFSCIPSRLQLYGRNEPIQFQF